MALGQITRQRSLQLSHLSRQYMNSQTEADKSDAVDDVLRHLDDWLRADLDPTESEIYLLFLQRDGLDFSRVLTDDDLQLLADNGIDVFNTKLELQPSIKSPAYQRLIDELTAKGLDPVIDEVEFTRLMVPLWVVKVSKPDAAEIQRNRQVDITIHTLPDLLKRRQHFNLLALDKLIVFNVFYFKAADIHVTENNNIKIKSPAYQRLCRYLTDQGLDWKIEHSTFPREDAAWSLVVTMPGF